MIGADRCINLRNLIHNLGLSLDMVGVLAQTQGGSGNESFKASIPSDAPPQPSTPTHTHTRTHTQAYLEQPLRANSTPRNH